MHTVKCGSIGPDVAKPKIYAVADVFRVNVLDFKKMITLSGKEAESPSRSAVLSVVKPMILIVGTITLVALTGLLVFMLFFLAATVNAIIISALMSLAAAGGFLVLFLACLTAIYIGALSVAVFVISATTISTIIAVIVATGWVGFFWVVWAAAKKSVDLTKQSLSTTSLAISAFSASRRPQQA